MKLQNVIIENFRGISNANLTLEGQNTVLFGMNGAGKSSILDCLAIMLSRVSAGISHNRVGAGRRQFQEKDIQNGYKMTNSQLTIDYENVLYSWSLSKQRNSTVGKIRKKNEVSSLIGQVHQMLESEPNSSIPLAVYYPVHRAVLDIPLRIRKKHSFDQISAYEGALTSGADFRVFFEWFRTQEDIENENRVRISKDYVDPLLNAVRNAIYSFLPGFTNLQVIRNPLRMIIYKEGMQLEVGQLSQGEKCLLAMVGDLARRLAIANPNLHNPLNGHGLILIDEIELHLHPSWQRKILNSLNETFPNLQFIVTTHSPQVLGEVDQMKSYILQWSATGVQINEAKYLFGKDTNRILEDNMDSSSRDEIIDTKIRNLFQLIQLKNWEKATYLYNHLTDILGNEDPELKKADIILTRWRRLKYESNN